MPPDLSALHGPYAELLREALDELSPPAARAALDIGCGPGLKAAWLAGRLAPSGLAVGVEIDRDSAAAARRAGLAALVADAHALPVRPGGADLAWMVAALGLFARPDVALTEARRALRPGGALVVAGAGERWVRPRRWPAGLAAALPAQPPLAPADGLGEELRAPLEAAGFGGVVLRAYLLAPAGLGAAAAALPLLAWAELAPLAPGLPEKVAAACAAAEAAAEPEPLPVLLVAAARAEGGGGAA